MGIFGDNEAPSYQVLSQVEYRRMLEQQAARRRMSRQELHEQIDRLEQRLDRAWAINRKLHARLDAVMGRQRGGSPAGPRLVVDNTATGP